MRVVIDTNIVMSALFFRGLPSDFLKLALVGKIHAVASDEIMAEYEETDRELALKIDRRDTGILLADVLERFEIITPKSKVNICRAPDDDKFIACAIDGKCKYIISGDKDLLSIRSFSGVEIVTVRNFMNEYQIINKFNHK